MKSFAPPEKNPGYATPHEDNNLQPKEQNENLILPRVPFPSRDKISSSHFSGRQTPTTLW